MLTDDLHDKLLESMQDEVRTLEIMTAALEDNDVQVAAVALGDLISCVDTRLTFLREMESSLLGGS